MPIREKATREDFELYEILKNPVLCTEFINNFDKMEWEEKFKLDWYQKQVLCDFNPRVSLACARAVGKTVSLSNMITWLLVNNIFPEDYIVYTVPSKVHLDPVFTSLVRLFRSNTFLTNFIETNKGINSSDHTINLLNGGSLRCRIAGQSGTGANVIGLHTPFVILDESGYYPWGTWLELQPIMNNWTPGSRLITSGVPTGMRESNVLYFSDMVDDGFTKHRISAYDNPRFSTEDEVRAIEQYGGKTSDDFIHFVIGRHGNPVYAVFDRRLMKIETYPVYKISLDGTKFESNIADYHIMLNQLPRLPDSAKNQCIMGVDLGYTEPTAIFIMYPDKYGIFRFHAKVEMRKVPYPIQEKLIDYMDTKYSPMVIGIDAGGVGKGPVHHLLEDEDYYHKGYKNKLFPIDFSANVFLGKDSDGKELTAKTKPFAVSLLQDYCNNHRIIFTSTDIDIITELERMTYTKNITGDVIYKTLTPKGGTKGEDHFTSALLCGTLAYYQAYELMLINPMKKLFTARWLT